MNGLTNLEFRECFQVDLNVVCSHVSANLDQIHVSVQLPLAGDLCYEAFASVADGTTKGMDVGQGGSVTTRTRRVATAPSVTTTIVKISSQRRGGAADTRSEAIGRTEGIVLVDVGLTTA